PPASSNPFRRKVRNRELGNEHSMENRNQYFTAQVSVADCVCEIRMNDVPVLEIKGGETMSVEVPLNQCVQSGINTLSFILSLAGGDNFSEIAWCEAIIYSRLTGSPREERVQIGGMIFSGEDRLGGKTGLEQSPDYADNTPTISQVSERVIQARRLVRLETPFPRWVWLSSEIIADTPQTRAALIFAYRQFWEQLNLKNVGEVRRLTAAKARELAAAYYITEADAHDRIEFQQHMADPDLTLHPFSEDGLRLEVFGNKRLARLVDANGDSPVIFVMTDRSLAFYMNMVYCNTAGDGWLQIR
ncbi:MAG: hypothetical protein ACRD68_01500, partial [Pyrinomonadaceae bacterium]